MRRGLRSIVLSDPGRLALAAVVVPFVVGVAVVVAQRGMIVYPGGDHALIELATRDAARGQRLLGPYSRFGWNHPGPAYFYALALPYRLLGGSAGLHAGVLLINALAAAGTVVVVRRVVGGRAAMGAAAVLLAVMLSLGPAVLRDAWNPYVIVLPTLLFAVLCAAALAGRRAALWPAAVVGSFVVQTHLAVAPLVVTLTAVAVAVRWRRRPVASAPVSLAAVACLALLAALWLPVLAEQVLAVDGNLGQLVRFATAAHGGHGLRDAALAVAVGASAFPLGAPAHSLPRIVGALPLLVAGAGLAAAAACLRMRRARALPLTRALGGTALLAAAASVAAASRVAGPLLGYLVLWTVVAPVVAWLGLALVAARRAPRLLGVAAAPLSVALTVSLAALPPLTAASHPPSAVAARAVTRRARAMQAERVLLRVGSHDQWSTAAGVAVALEAAGFGVAVQDELLWMFGRSRRAHGDESLVIVLFDGAPPRVVAAIPSPVPARRGFLSEPR